MLKLAIRSAILSVVAGFVRFLGPSRRWQSRALHRASTGNILLIRLDLLGDVMISLSAAHAIKEWAPETQVTFLTLPQTAALAEDSLDVDRVISMDTNLIRAPQSLLRVSTISHLAKSVSELRRTRYDMAIILYGKTASLLGLAARAKIRVGFSDEVYGGAVDIRVDGGRFVDRKRRHDDEFNHTLVAEATGEHIRKPTHPGRLGRGTKRDSVHVETMLASYGLTAGSKIAVLHAGSSHGVFKRWPEKSFISLAQQLDRIGLRPIVVGTSQDREVASRICAKSRAISFAGTTSLQDLITLLGCAAVVISSDSGPLHIAAAMGTPVVGIYGPTDPMVNGPITAHGQPVAVMRRDIACSPCYSVHTSAECQLGHPICMDLVRPEEVSAMVIELLAGLVDNAYPAGAS
jgi:lipopolysaccharide heptosyltransferase II